MKTLRFVLSDNVLNSIIEFAKLHKLDHRLVYKEEWKKWLEANNQMVQDEINRMRSIGYNDCVLTKMFDAGRYYFRKKELAKQKKEQIKAQNVQTVQNEQNVQNVQNVQNERIHEDENVEEDDEDNEDENIKKKEKRYVTLDKDILYDKIIFCCGSNNGEMPYFSDIPIEKTKGQTLTISCKDLPENESLNRKTFVLPLENNTFKIGATYEWDDGSLNTTKEARELLLENFSVISDLPIKVIDQVAGIRPTVLDRRPVLGQHKIHKKLFIFNGLGAKGYLMAPTLAREMAEYLLGEGTISKEVGINRFY
jgi:hypothetical protein